MNNGTFWIQTDSLNRTNLIRLISFAVLLLITGKYIHMNAVSYNMNPFCFSCLYCIML